MKMIMKAVLIGESANNKPLEELIEQVAAN